MPGGWRLGTLALDVFTSERDDYVDPASVTCGHCDLGAMAFCSGLTTEQFRRFITALDQTTVEQNSTIFREGDPALHLYTITAGAVKLYKLLSDGRRQIVAFMFPGDFFGLSASGTYAYTAEAMLPLMVCRFPRRKLEPMFREIPLLEKRLLGATTHELAAAHEQILLLGRKTARERLSSFLMALWRRLGGSEDQPTPIALPMGRSDIADFLGLTIETVSRTFTGLRREGLIFLPDASHVAIRRPKDLARIAEGL